MNDTSENPPFDFENSRRWRKGDPVSSEVAKLRRRLRQLVDAHKAGQKETLRTALTEAESLLAE